MSDDIQRPPIGELKTASGVLRFLLAEDNRGDVIERAKMIAGVCRLEQDLPYGAKVGDYE